MQGLNDDTDRDVLARHGRSFNWAGRLLPESMLENAAGLYALCRELDDAVDEAQDPEQARRRLARYRDAARTRLSLILARSPSRGAVPDVLCYRALDELVRGVEGDIGGQVIADGDELIAYAYRVAGTVGILMCRVLGVRDERALAHAIDMGIAMQLTNIARDVAEDYESRCIYIPRDWLEGEEDFKHASCAALPRLLELAGQYYKSGEDGLSFLPIRARLGILCAARIYRAIGVEIARDPARVWRARVYVSRWRKLLITCGVIGAFMLRPGLHLKPGRHDASLHKPLSGLPGAHKGEDGI